MDQNEKKKLRKLKAVEESDDEEEGKEGHGASLSRLFTHAAHLADTDSLKADCMLVELFFF